MARERESAKWQAGGIGHCLFSIPYVLTKKNRKSVRVSGHRVCRYIAAKGAWLYNYSVMVAGRWRLPQTKAKKNRGVESSV